jgi:hypothetical protein
MAYKVGDTFEDKNGDRYLLAQVDCGKCALICLDKDRGNRYSNPFEVKNIGSISTAEIRGMLGIYGDIKIRIIPDDNEWIGK